ncbi:glycine cleavage system protein GcvH [Rothia endophytica]|uniref:glycine cleavage system protein GcvH n=1 Tax=Rothia endophytica TaxID=1324766 RepID=UPI001EFFCCA4|nr:glycine cleavage system protein GcvH [Rothia endophytica]
MSNIPAELKYTKEHEWVGALTADGTVRIGVTDHAQDALGDVVYVDLPEVGETLEADATFGEIESTKSVSDLFAPINGEVVAVNDELEGAPETVNSDPYGAGWLIEVRPADAADLENLMSAADYETEIA